MKDKPFKDTEIKELVERKIRQSVGVYDSQLSKERETVLKYYNRELPKRSHAGSSSYVSTTVYDSLQAMKAQLLRTFATGREIARFEPQSAQDVEPSRIATEYVNYVVSRQNPSHKIFQTVIEDGLKARVGVVKVYWDTVKKYQDRKFDGLPADAVLAMGEQPEVAKLDADIDIETGTAKGELTLVTDESQVRIDCVAPENFGVEPQATSLHGSFHFHRVLKTKAEIKAMGLDTKKLKDKTPDGGQTASMDIETVARFSEIDSGYNPRDTDSATGQYWLYESYVYKDAEDRRKLYKVISVASEILDVEEVDRSPFVVFTPLPVSHSFWGDNFAKLSIPTQNSTTMLQRAILDHTAITTNPRYMVSQGGLVNPQELLNNRLGGIVNVTSPDSVVPLQQAQLNPFVFQSIEMLKANNEQTTGISSLSQGLNQDAISNQNSQGMINDLVDLSMGRQEGIAREFAFGFLVPLYLEVYRLVLENEKRESVIEVAGNWVDINPRTWIERKHCVPILHFSPSDAKAEGMQYAQLLTMASQDPALNEMIDAESRYNLGVKVMQLMGVKDPQTYIKHPSQLPPKQPDQAMVAQIQIAQMQAQAGMMAAQAEVQKVQNEGNHKAMADELARMRLELDTVTRERDAARKDADVANRIDIAQRETALLEQDFNNPNADTRGIISP